MAGVNARSFTQTAPPRRVDDPNSNYVWDGQGYVPLESRTTINPRNGQPVSPANPFDEAAFLQENKDRNDAIAMRDRTNQQADALASQGRQKFATDQEQGRTAAGFQNELAGLSVAHAKNTNAVEPALLGQSVEQANLRNSAIAQLMKLSQQRWQPNGGF